MKLPELMTPKHRSGARILRQGKHTFYFSDETCIGYKVGNQQLRVSLSPTNETFRRHMADMVIIGWDCVPREEFDQIISDL